MSKYGAVRTEVDGIVFASKREAARYQELCLLQKGGAIQGLELQRRYPLVVNGVRVGTYVSDFTYVENGVATTEDVKSKPTCTPVYRLKKKLMKAIYGIDIKEVHTV